MKNWTPWIIAICVVAYLAFDMASAEYAKIRIAISETKGKTDAVADETKATMEAIKQTIEDLRSKFMTLEMHLSGNAGQLKPVDDVAEEQPKPAVAPKIVMHSASWCGPCQKWKRDSLPQWKAIGWTVDVVEDDATKQTVPWFEITDSDGVAFKVVGYMDLKAFEAAKANAVRSKN